MILYVAGGVKRERSDAIAAGAGLLGRLVSYAEPGAEAAAVRLADAGRLVFMDSGAYSVWKSGRTVDLLGYIRLLRDHGRRFVGCAALDVIGDPDASDRNWRTMRDEGLDVWPAHHQGTPTDHLRRLLDDGARSVAFGGLVAGAWGRNGGRNIDHNERRRMLDDAFAVLERHWPIRVHAFGVTSQWILERYPIFSADSTAAFMGAAFGDVHEFVGSRYVASGECKYLTRGASATEHPGTVDGICEPGQARLNREAVNYDALRRYERYLTDLWAVRGVVWEGAG